MSNIAGDSGPKVIPAQLSFLAIYNPSLGTTDDTIQNQILFYYSRASQSGRRKASGNSNTTITDKSSSQSPDRGSTTQHEEENERLRQIGLAQGMVNFARSFSGGQKVDNVETEKSRIVLHELEPDWWILASIDLTRIPIPPLAVGKAQSAGSAAASVGSPALLFEYSAREVSPAKLLVRQLLDAHAVFLLHNASSLSELFARLQQRQSKFFGLLERFWTRFAVNWDVMLHGNPSVDMIGGMKLAAGGELGMGVGEEEWGSGEREVLEDFARRTDGLVDMVVSRFGHGAEDEPGSGLKAAATTAEMWTRSGGPLPEPWMGISQHQQDCDGVVFSGIGNLSHSSLGDISLWMRLIYAQGEHAYGVRESPSSDRKRRKRRAPPSAEHGKVAKEESPKPVNPPDPDPLPGIPPPIVSAVQRSLEAATVKVNTTQQSSTTKDMKQNTLPPMGSETWMKYLTLGYGTAWGPSGRFPSAENSAEVYDNDSLAPMQHIDPESHIDMLKERMATHIAQENSGYFLIGLKGDVEDDSDEISSDEEQSHGWNPRILVRTLHVELKRPLQPNDRPKSPLGSDQNSPSLPLPAALSTNSPEMRHEDDETPTSQPKSSKGQTTRSVSPLLVVVYVHRPFIYTLLFDPGSKSLSMPPFYRNIHTFLAPLQMLLVRRTGPQSAHQRMSGLNETAEEVWDLTQDSQNATVCSSIPNIPMPITSNVPRSRNTATSRWSRADALNVHSAILEILRGTMARGEADDEVERSVKTARGWWVVWMRLEEEHGKEVAKEDCYSADDANPSQEADSPAQGKQVILVRRARDGAGASVKAKGRSVSAWGFGTSESKRLDGTAMSLGFDAKRYVEGLVGLGR